MTNHAHPLVSKSDVADLNERYSPWRIERVGYTSDSVSYWETQVRNTETNERIYLCEGWNKASRGQALLRILERR